MIYLIDFENVHEEGFSALGRLGEKDAVYCFFTRNVAKISMSALAGIRSGQLHFIEAESGKQSLDLVLVSYLGYLIGTRQQELYYDIVSNDNGFAKVAEFWNKRGNGLRVRIRKTTDLNQKIEPVKAQPVETVPTEAGADPKQEIVKQENAKPKQSKQRGRQRTQRQRASKQEQQTPAVSVSVAGPASAPVAGPAQEAVSIQTADTKLTETTPVEEKTVVRQPVTKVAEVQKPQTETKPAEVPKAQAETKTMDPAAAAALEAAGINAAAMEFIQAQAEKYRDDKNMKQLVYRAVVKKYGQKTGTQIYNSAKKLLLK